MISVKTEPSGFWVEALIAKGCQVFEVDPLAVAPLP